MPTWAIPEERKVRQSKRKPSLKQVRFLHLSEAWSNGRTSQSSRQKSSFVTFRRGWQLTLRAQRCTWKTYVTMLTLVFILCSTSTDPMAKSTLATNHDKGLKSITCICFNVYSQLRKNVYASTSNIEILERFQSKVLRMITDTPWFVPNVILRQDLQIPSVKEEIRRFSIQYSSHLQTHPNSLSVHLTEPPEHLPTDLITRVQE
jgi:hypothetical protein